MRVLYIDGMEFLYMTKLSTAKMRIERMAERGAAYT